MMMVKYHILETSWSVSFTKCTKVERFHHLDWVWTIVTSEQSKLESCV